MSRNRVYVGPGGMLYVIVAMLILGAAIWTQANLLFWSFGLMIGGLLVSMLISLLILRKVTVQRLLPGHGVAGEALVIRYRLVNRKRILPVFNVVIREQWGKGRKGWRRDGPVAETPQRLGGQPTGWVLHLGPNQTVQAEAMCWPLKRGMLKFERIEVSTSFPFGVLRKVIDVPQPDQVLIYPRLYRMNRRLLGRMSQVDMTGRKQLDRSGGMEEFFGLRPYRAGDSFKTIDWKHTAKTSNLVSREFTQPSPPKIMLLLDLTGVAVGSAERTEGDAGPAATTGNGPHSGPYPIAKGRTRFTPIRPDPNDPVERAVSLAASLICDAYFYGYQVGMAVRGARCTTFPMHHSLPHRAKMLEALSTLDAGQPAQMDISPPSEPSVLIHCGGSQRTGDSRCLVLGASGMEQFVREVEGGMMELLSRRVAPITRRDEMTMAAVDSK
jgi:uncharacterized protein (DUF58 family)